MMNNKRAAKALRSDELILRSYKVKYFEGVVDNSLPLLVKDAHEVLRSSLTIKQLDAYNTVLGRGTLGVPKIFDNRLHPQR